MITSEPSSLTVATGGSATFSVVASGSGTLSYQWRHGGSPIAQATGSSYTIASAIVGDAGTYDVVVSNGSGSVTSSAAVLTVITSGILANGSFESGYTAWTPSGNQSVVSGGSYQASNGANLVAFNGGNQTPNGILLQSFTTTSGQSYTLAFDVGVLAYNLNQQRLQVTVQGGSLLLSQTVTVTGDGTGVSRWTPQSFTFVANSATTTLTFQDVSTATSALDLLLDNVRITVPAPPPVWTLTVSSSNPASGVAVSVSPSDNNGQGNGTTGFTRSYNGGTVVSLTAPSTAGGNTFQKWQTNSVDFSTSTSMSLAMNANYTATAVYSSLPVITSQPSSLTVAVGGSATFSVVASGPGTLTYQWRFNGAPITGATASSYSIASVQSANAGNYDVIVSNASGSVTSAVAVLTVAQPGTLTNGSFESGYTGWTHSGNQFSVSGGGYQASNGTNLVVFNGGEQTPNGVLSQSFTTTSGQSYTLAFDVGVLAYNLNQQRLQVTVQGGSLLLSQTVTVTGDGTGVSRWAPQSFTFVANSATTTLTFQDVSTATSALDLLLDNVRITVPAPPPVWTLTVSSSNPASGVAVSVSPSDNNGQGNGTTGFTRSYNGGTVVSLTAPSTAGGNTFQKWQTNSVDFGTSTSMSLAMNANYTATAVYSSLPVITSQPSSLTVAVGGSATFSVVASGPGTLTYQWRFNGAPITGATASSYSIASVQSANAGNYDVIVSNASGSVTSSVAVLTVAQPGTLTNGSFESGYTGWTHSGNQFSVSGGGYQASNGTNLVAFNGGNQTPNGVLSQSFTTTSGQSYTLAFDVGVLAYNLNQQRLQVTVQGGSLLLSQTVTVTGDGTGVSRWTPQSFTFVANSATTTLTFQDVSTATMALDLLLDNVRVTVP